MAVKDDEVIFGFSGATSKPWLRARLASIAARPRFEFYFACLSFRLLLKLNFQSGAYSSFFHNSTSILSRARTSLDFWAFRVRIIGLELRLGILNVMLEPFSRLAMPLVIKHGWAWPKALSHRLCQKLSSGNACLIIVSFYTGLGEPSSSSLSPFQL